MEEIILKTQLEQVLSQAGVGPGDVILVQASNWFLDQLYGGAQCLISVLSSLTGKNGAIIAPAFTFQCLDPAIIADFPYEEWPAVRQNTFGFQADSSMPASRLAAAMMLNKAKRSTHPVYSFVFSGKVQKNWLQQKLDNPISFDHVLQAFTNPDLKAINLLIGIPLRDSLLLHAKAYEMNLGVTSLERAAVFKNGRNTACQYLVQKAGENELDAARRKCSVYSSILNEEKIFILSLNNARASKPATLEMLLETVSSKLEY